MATTALSIEGLSKIYRSGFIPRRRTALQDVTFDVNEGEIFGFLGPNGAGKTTTIKVVVGLLRATAGKVFVYGAPTGSIEAKRRIGFLPENPSFYQYLRGSEFLEFCADLCDVPREVSRGRIPQLLRMVGLFPAPTVPIRKYSKGMVQRLGLAQAMVNDPALLILDEPLSGLDPIGRKEFRDIILEFRRQGKTIFFSSHILQDAEMICDRAAILVGGRIRRCGSIEELTTTDISGYEISVSGCDRERVAGIGHVVAVQDDTVFLRVDGSAALDRALAEIRSSSGRIVSVVPIRRTLEDVFLTEVEQSGDSNIDAAREQR